MSILWTIPAFPLAGFLILALFGGGLTRKESTRIGVGSVGLSALAALIVAVAFFAGGAEARTQTLWEWVVADGFSSAVSFRLDALSLLMVLVVTLIGFLIHVYSTEYMAHDDSYARFFACMNLFVAAMLVLVLADNFLFLFLGWEGVGLCSYLLIGFWYSDPANGKAATKAFLTTRVGDVALVIGLFYIYAQLGTLDIETVLQRAPEAWAVGSTAAVFAALCLLGGALGKSGQLPLQVWLPDAMAGPTPVSALIHAATMVTAGVYLIARTHPVFELAPSVQHFVGVIGALTLLIAGTCALVQRDIKRVLAYSTISQIGYMFLALGAGAWSAAMFHFMTHAIFKALLFMSAGAIILSLHHEQDMFKMGGLRRQLPLVFWTFLIGALSLAALPLVTAGFYSKDMILWEVWSSPQGGKGLWAAGLLGAFITSLYTFRMVFVTFFGESNTLVSSLPGRAVKIPLVVLAVGATLAGFLELPRTLGHWPAFSHYLEHTLPAPGFDFAPVNVELALQGAAACVVAAGLLIAWACFLPRKTFVDRLARSSMGGPFYRILTAGWGFDALYHFMLVAPFGASARANRADGVDLAFAGVDRSLNSMAQLLRLTQTGKLRWYMAGIAAGAIVATYLVVYR